jgi:hypothetical protein
MSTPPDHPQYNDIAWHALNYRGAIHPIGAQDRWAELEACIDRKVAAAVAAERDRCAAVAESWATKETATTCANIAAAIRGQANG